MAKQTLPKRCSNCDCEAHDLDVHFPLCLISTTTRRIAEKVGDADDHILGLAGMLDNKLSRIADGLGNIDSTLTRIADALENRKEKEDE